MGKFAFFNAIAVSALCAFAAQPYAVLDGGKLKIGNDQIERVFDYNGGNLITLSVTDKKAGITTLSEGKSADIFIPAEKDRVFDGYFKTRIVPDSEIRSGRLECEVGYSRGGIKVKRVFAIPEKSPAIACRIYISGKPKATDWVGLADSAPNLQNIESLAAARSKQTTRVNTKGCGIG